MTGKYSYLVAGLVTLAAWTWTASARAEVRYTITDLGAWRPYAINDFGVVVGYGPLVWKNGSLTTIQVPGGGLAYGLNNSGDVVGAMVGPPGWGFLWRAGSLTMLGTFGGLYSFATDISDSGVIAGAAKTPAGYYHAFTYANGVMTDLGTFGGAVSGAAAVNSQSVVVGAAETDGPFPPGGSPPSRAFVYANGVMTPIAGDYSVANDINDKGQVVGRGPVVGSPGVFAPFLWDAGSLTYLPSLGSYAMPTAINEVGVVVGYGLAGGGENAFVWENGVVRNLNDLIPPNSFWATLEQAADINESGQIVGYGETVGHGWHGFLLTPIPEPSSLVLLTVAAVATIRRATGANRGTAAPGDNHLDAETQRQAWGYGGRSDSVPDPSCSAPRKWYNGGRHEEPGGPEGVSIQTRVRARLGYQGEEQT